MMQATTSPIRTTPRSSEMAQRLQEAAALDSHLGEVERARVALEQARMRKPPPPPPSSPRSRALNRVIELARQQMTANSKLGDSSASIALDTLKTVVEQVLNEHTSPDEEGVSDADDPQTMPADSNGYRRRLPFEDEARLATRVVPSGDSLALVRTGGFDIQPALTQVMAPGRFWRATVGSATLRHGRVEYEIRSALTSISDETMEVTTGTSFVRRRYRDFDRLYHMLSKAMKPHEFVLIPNLPPKDMTSVVSGNRADPDFVWDRRVGLQLWLRFVCDHHVIRNSTLLREFLWEPASAAVSSTESPSDLDDMMNPTAELALWERALRQQVQIMERRFGNSVVALTAMKTHVRTMVQAYHKAGSKADAVVKADASLARSLRRASKAFFEWADFERSAGQNYGFVTKFAEALPALDAKRPIAVPPRTSSTSSSAASSGYQQPQPFSLSSNQAVSSATGGLDSKATTSINDDALVSFAEKDLQLVPANINRTVSHRNSQELFRKECIEDPSSPGASCEVRSMKAMQTTLQMWGDVVLPKTEKNFVDPKQTSPLYQDKTGTESSKLGTRVACEWTELENLKCAMVRDSAIWMVEEQIRKAREEVERWTVLRESIKAQEVEISSLVAIGDVVMFGGGGLEYTGPVRESGINGSIRCMGAGDHFQGDTGSSSTTSQHHHLIHQHDVGVVSSSSSSTSSSPIDRLSSRLQQQQVHEHDQSRNGKATSETAAVMLGFDERILDANLDEIQARYYKEHERADDDQGGDDEEPKDRFNASSISTSSNGGGEQGLSAGAGVASSATSSKFHDPESSRYLNPFFSDEED